MPAQNTFDPLESINDVLAMFESQIKSKGLKLQKTMVEEGEPSELPEFLVGDEQRMKQVICNLVKNAIKFTTKGLVLLTASYDRPQGQIFIKVSDTGKGIAAEEISTLC